MVTYTCNPALERQRQKQVDQKIKVILYYRMSVRSACVTLRKSTIKQNKTIQT